MTTSSSARQGLYYLLQGLAITRRSPRLFVQIVAVFSVPALLAAMLTLIIPSGQLWSVPIFFLLDSTTALVGPVVFMMAVGAGYRAQAPTLAQVVRRALPWLPRYLWTNVHTSAIFWVPVGGLLVLRNWVAAYTSSFDGLYTFAMLLFGLVLVCLAIYLHSRTLLAPFLAVHSNLPASQASWESWQLSGAHLNLVVSTLLVSAAPLALPLVGVILVLASDMRDLTTVGTMLPHLLGVSLQMVRLTLIPAAYVLYKDVWEVETVRERQGSYAWEPWFVRALLQLTAWLPPLGPMGRNSGSAASSLPSGYIAASAGVGTVRGSEQVS